MASDGHSSAFHWPFPPLHTATPPESHCASPLFRPFSSLPRLFSTPSDETGWKLEDETGWKTGRQWQGRLNRRAGVALVLGECGGWIVV